MDMFLVKKIIAALLMPLPFCLLLAFLGLLLQWLFGRRRMGRFLTSLGMALLLLFSLQPIADQLLAPLENRYPPLAANRLRPGSVDFIVVLGGGHTSDPRLPVTSQIGEATLARLTEAIRLQRLLPGTRLLLSGGQVFFDPTPNAVIMANVAQALGVPKNILQLEIQSRDTEDEAKLIRGIVSTRPFILVTSAYHLPRAMLLFERFGMHPIPAPANFLAKKSRGPAFWSFFPRARQLDNSRCAIHEYLGLAWITFHKG